MASDTGRPYPSDYPAPAPGLPVLAIRENVVFPLTVQPLAINRPASIEAVNRALAGDRLLFLTLQGNVRDEPEPGDVRPVGTMGAIRQTAKAPAGGMHIVVEGLTRARADHVTRSGGALQARVAPLPDETAGSIEVEACVRRLQDLMDRAALVSAGMSQELRGMVTGMDPLRAAYLLASMLDIRADEKQQILELDDLAAKLIAVTAAFTRELELLEMKSRIESAAHQEMSAAQREYYLRQQIKAIQAELGEGEKSEIRDLRVRLDAAAPPPPVAIAATREIDRLERMKAASQEYQMIRTYLDWVLDVPWSTTTADRLDPAAAREVLDADHFDLEKVKERIVEYLAVHRLKAARSGDAARIKGPVLCFVGPPGVGKTSLGLSIARAMNRRFIRLALGGVRDEAEIRGHRRSYIGAMPGRIVQALKSVGAMNPVLMLDEIDKMASGFQGDPAAALLEVLDPAQNHAFRDHYLEVDVDLSRVLFITTANQLGTIHSALLDRMEIIALSGYTDEEKLHIIRRYLIPRQIEEHGLAGSPIAFDDGALRRIVSDYTREAGVRNLERQIGAVARKIAARAAFAQTGASAQAIDTPVRIGAADVPEYLGPPRFHHEVAFRTSRAGVATGVAWTEAGGEVLFVEARLLPSGQHNLILTGQLGHVMQESARAALSHIRAQAASLGVSPELLDTSDFHVHIPAGAIPKDGPSAGVTMATAMVSALKDRPIRQDVAMTGEITLSGLVLPVGGIREKVLAARRHGITIFVLPARNEADLAELPPEATRDMIFKPVSTLEETLAIALPPQ